MIRKQHKKYRKPRKVFDKARIEEENEILKKYGLKNKKEILRAEAYIGKIRNQAKKLITASEKEQENFINKLLKIGLIKENAKIDDVLGLNMENLLNRRLQTLVLRKGLATTPKQARQFITHKHVLVDGCVVNVPSYVIPVKLEGKITLKLERKKPEKKEKKTEAQLAETPAEESANEKKEGAKE